MTLSLFKLSPAAWLKPQMVGRAIQGTQCPQLLRWAKQAPGVMREVGLDPKRVSSFETVTSNLEIVAAGRDSIRAWRAREKLARLIAGVRDEAQWGEVVQRAQWPQNVATIFAEAASRPSRPEITESKRQEWRRVAQWFGDSESVFDQRAIKFWDDDAVGYRYYFYDIVRLVMAGQNNIRRCSEAINQRIYRAILNANVGTIKTFQRLSEGKLFDEPDYFYWNARQLELLTYLFEKGNENDDALWLLAFVNGNSAQEIPRYRKYFKRYSEKPVLRLSPYSALSEDEKLAIYVITKRTYNRMTDEMLERHEAALLRRKKFAFATPRPFPYFDDYFEAALKVECALARFNKSPVSLENFARRLSQASFYDEYDDWKHPYLILSFILAPLHFVADEKVQKVAEALFRKEASVREAFRNNLDALPLAVSLDPATELLEMGLPFDGELFQRYASLPKEQRLQAAAEGVDSRAKELVHNPQTPLGSLEDPFEVMAILRTLGDQAPEPGTVLDILRESKVPPRSKDTYYAPFQFEVRKLNLPPHSAVSKLSLYAGKLGKLSDVDTLIDEIQDVLSDFVLFGPAQFRDAPEIHGALQRIEGLSLDWDLLEDGRSRFEESTKKKEEVLKILEDVLQFFSKMIQERVSALMTHRDPAQRGRIKQRVIDEFADYFGRLLVAWSVDEYFWTEPRYSQIYLYGQDEPTWKEAFDTLDQLAHFFGPQLETAISHFFKEENFPLPSKIKLRFLSKEGEYYDEDVLKEVDGMVQNKNNMISDEKVEVRLIPDVGELACFYGYMSKNCLAREDWAIHAMNDRGFVPYRIVVGGEWRGVVQTFTRFVSIDGSRRKLLIVSGIDPQPDLLIDTEGFLTGLEEGFSRIAAQGDYTFAVVPAKAFAQSSRQDFLRREFRRYEIRLPIDRPVGFPQIGIRSNGRPLYYSNVEHGEAWHDEFLVFRTPSESESREIAVSRMTAAMDLVSSGRRGHVEERHD